MRWSARRQKFRAILNGNTCIHPGSVADPMTARITQEIGFEVGIFAGSLLAGLIGTLILSRAKPPSEL